MSEIQKKFKTIEDLTADFTQTIKPALQSSSKYTGLFYYKKQDKFRVEMKNQTIISDGQTIWNYNSKLNQVVISYLEDESSSFSLEKYIMNYPQLCKISSSTELKDGEQYSVLSLTPKDLELEFKTVKLWSDKEYLVKKLDFVNLDDMEFSIVLKNILINQNLSDDKFIFIPPKGSQVIDLK